MSTERPDEHNGSNRGLPELPAAEHWLVDGYNALHAVLLGGEARDEWWRAEQRQRLIDRVTKFRDAGATIQIVFDGSRPAEDADPSQRVRVIFAPSADDWLVEQVRLAPHPNRIAIVTSDRQVAGRCRHAGAAVVRPHAFLSLCAALDPVEAKSRTRAPDAQ